MAKSSDRLTLEKFSDWIWVAGGWFVIAFFVSHAVKWIAGTQAFWVYGVAAVCATVTLIVGAIYTLVYRRKRDK